MKTNSLARTLTGGAAALLLLGGLTACTTSSDEPSGASATGQPSAGASGQPELAQTGESDKSALTLACGDTPGMTMTITRSGEALVLDVDLGGLPLAEVGTVGFLVERVVEGERVHFSNNDMRVAFTADVGLDKLAGETGLVDPELRINKPDPVPYLSDFEETERGFSVAVPGMASQLEGLSTVAQPGLDLVYAQGYVGPKGEATSCSTGRVGPAAEGSAFLSEGTLVCFAKDANYLATPIPNGETMATFTVSPDDVVTLTRTDEMPGFQSIWISSAPGMPDLTIGATVSIPRSSDGSVGHQGFLTLAEDPATCSTIYSENPFK